MIPKRKKRQRSGIRDEDGPLQCPSHRRWVRGFECSIAGKLEQLGDGYAKHHECEGRIEAHHVTTKGAGGGDDECVPLCSKAHKQGHDIGWDTFTKKYRVDLKAIAERLWRTSPHGVKYRAWKAGQ